MPTAASYLRGNDYNTLKFSPFQLPVNDIAKTIMAKTEYWNEGASRVKARYDDALGLSLTNPENQQIKKDYIQKSEEMIKSLASQNLGNPDVQQAGVGIFKNLFADEGILYDDQLTKHFGKVRNDYYATLKKDPSKASTRNLAYAMEDMEAFQNDPDRTSGKKYFERRRDYIPYYDPADDIDTALKHCKADSVTTQSPTPTLTGYSLKTIDKGISAAKASDCFAAGLSEQAKQQINIDGYMAFRNNKEGLATSYADYLNEGSKSIIDTRTQIAVKLADLNKKKTQGIITKLELDSLDAYKKMDKSYSDQLLNTTQTIDRLNKKDFSPLDKDYAGISGLVMAHMKNSQFGKAFSYDEFTKEMIADPASMLKMSIMSKAALQDDEQKFLGQDHYQAYIYQDALHRLDNASAENIAKIAAASRGSNKGKKGFDANGDPIIDVIGTHEAPGIAITNATPTTDDIAAYSNFTNDVKAVDNGLANNNQWIKGRLKDDRDFITYLGTINPQAEYGKPVNTGGIFDLSPDELVKNPAFQHYLENAKSNSKLYKDLIKWRDNDLKLKVRQGALNLKSQKLEAQIDPSLKSENYIKTVPSVKLTDGNIIDSQEVLKYVQNQNSAIKVTTKSKTVATSNGPGGITSTETIQEAIRYDVNGKTYKKGDANFEKIQNLVDKVGVETGENNQKLAKRRLELYSNHNYNMVNYMNIEDQDNDSVKALNIRLSQVPKGDSKEDTKPVSYDPATGNVVVYAPNLSSGNEKDLKQLQGMNIGAEVKPVDKEGSPHLFILTKVAGFNEGDRLGLDAGAVQNALLLKEVADKSAADGRIGNGEAAYDLLIPIKKAGNYGSMDWHIHAVKQVDGNNSASFEYILTDENGVERGREASPFLIMKIASDVNSKST